MAPASKNTGSRVFIPIFIRPLPDMANQVENTKGTGSLGMGIHIGGWRFVAARVKVRHAAWILLIAPRVKTTIGALRGVLP